MMELHRSGGAARPPWCLRRRRYRMSIIDIVGPAALDRYLGKCRRAWTSVSRRRSRSWSDPRWLRACGPLPVKSRARGCAWWTNKTACELPGWTSSATTFPQGMGAQPASPVVLRKPSAQAAPGALAGPRSRRCQASPPPAGGGWHHRHLGRHRQRQRGLRCHPLGQYL